MQLPGILAFCLALAPQAASAAADDFYHDRKFVVWARAFFASSDTAIKIDSQTTGVSGTLLDLEHNLGIDDSATLPVIGFRWRFAKKHAVDLAYFELNRSGQLIIDTQIRWGDLIYPIATDVNSFFDTKVSRVAYRYSLVTDPKKEFAIGGGLHWTEMEAGISATSIGSGKVSSIAPLPMLTLSSDYRLSPKWSVHLLGEWFGLEVGGIGGEIWHLDAGVAWDMSEHLSLNLGYNFFNVDFGAGDPDFLGLFNYTYTGPFLGVAMQF